MSADHSPLLDHPIASPTVSTPTPSLVTRLADELAAVSPVERGLVWTTDAPYRETREQLRRWLEGRYHITRWTEMPKGGHFAAFEQPQLLVDDVRAFFATLR